MIDSQAPSCMFPLGGYKLGVVFAKAPPWGLGAGQGVRSSSNPLESNSVFGNK